MLLWDSIRTSISTVPAQPQIINRCNALNLVLSLGIIFLVYRVVAYPSSAEPPATPYPEKVLVSASWVWTSVGSAGDHTMARHSSRCSAPGSASTLPDQLTSAEHAGAAGSQCHLGQARGRAARQHAPACSR